MRTDSALSRLKDGELCIVTTKDGEQEARWSVSGWCFFILHRGTPTICAADEIEEWRPASMDVTRRL
ncbi:hypothetical protein RY831_10540 [Noviherbaspirillum sp. CPCC 100848]|uniref:Uncharacterized protein n=1 Tax=Noviherbaspirillum album TaxID=3080276 RepID=A0ABU6J7H8_9BURK|nr:hypothetical protein [Noviherbaspirillum sp. CPCC 100848]MEC4719589.1 hypothetical protein [Noviherbaspirillum sp. CPCC 100848]